MKTLVIAEKPSVARDIVAALPGSFDDNKEFYEGDDYVVTFAVGRRLRIGCTHASHQLGGQPIHLLVHAPQKLNLPRAAVAHQIPSRI